MRVQNISRVQQPVLIQNADTGQIENLILGPGIHDLPPGFAVPYAERARYASFLRVVDDSGATYPITSEKAGTVTSPASDPRPGNAE